MCIANVPLTSMLKMLSDPKINHTSGSYGQTKQVLATLIKDFLFSWLFFFNHSMKYPKSTISGWPSTQSMEFFYFIVTLRVQNEQFSEETGFILRYTENEV